MKNAILSSVVLAVVASLVCAVGFAQSSGEETYKARCQIYHGATGAADTAPAKVIGVKPVTDPAVMKMDFAEILGIARNGKNKMQAFMDKLTDAQIKDAVIYFRAPIK
jgi:mono/diheme cytochrome c family protein